MSEWKAVYRNKKRRKQDEGYACTGCSTKYYEPGCHQTGPPNKLCQCAKCTGKTIPMRIGIITGLRLGTIDKREVTLSYAHTQRRKTIKRFKEEFAGQLHPDRWYLKFRGHVDRFVKERLGPPIGTLEDIVNAVGKGRGNGKA